MRVGILTFHRACNYGAVLQCYALQEVLKSLGHKVEVVDYRSHHIEKTYKIIKTYNGIRTFARSLLTMSFTAKQQKNFKAFRDKYLCLSKVSYYNVNELANSDYDCYIIGSDQVWSQRINYGYDDVYWGNFSPSKRKISYAASMGGHNPFTQDEIMKIQKLLDNFHSISVREDVLKADLDSIYKRNKIFFVLDPTLIASPQVYESIMVKPCTQNYVLYYQQGHHPFTKEIVSYVAKKLNCAVIVIAGEIENYSVPSRHYSLANLSVPEFLGLFRYASFVFASSFHGTAFSVVFEKDFYYVGNARVERSKSLLDNIGLSDRLIYSDKLVEPVPVDYEKIREKKARWIGESINYLKQSLA